VIPISKRTVAAVLFWFGVLGGIGAFMSPNAESAGPVTVVFAVALMLPYLYIAFREGHHSTRPDEDITENDMGGGEWSIRLFSGNSIRMFTLFLFLIGIVGVGLVLYALAIGALGPDAGSLGMVLWVVVMLAPYTAIRARDRYPRLQVLR